LSLPKSRFHLDLFVERGPLALDDEERMLVRSHHHGGIDYLGGLQVNYSELTLKLVEDRVHGWHGLEERVQGLHSLTISNPIISSLIPHVNKASFLIFVDSTPLINQTSRRSGLAYVVTVSPCLGLLLAALHSGQQSRVVPRQPDQLTLALLQFIRTFIEQISKFTVLLLQVFSEQRLFSS
jgi:hypothetical protein